MFGQPAFLGQVKLAPASDRTRSPGRDWWLHHIRNTRALAERSFAGDTPGALAAIKDLWDAVLKWQNITQSWQAGVLMGEHTVLAKLFVDCLAKKQGDACVSTATDALLANVDEQRALFPRQPDRFADLFLTHVKLVAAYVPDLAEGRMDDFQADWAKALQNGDELGAFTDEVFFRR
jgi:hypothetical protein